MLEKRFSELRPESYITVLLLETGELEGYKVIDVSDRENGGKHLILRVLFHGINDECYLDIESHEENEKFLIYDSHYIIFADYIDDDSIIKGFCFKHSNDKLRKYILDNE